MKRGLLQLAFLISLVGCASGPPNGITGGGTSEKNEARTIHRVATTGPSQSMTIQVDESGALTLRIDRGAPASTSSTSDFKSSSSATSQPSAFGVDLPSLKQNAD